MAQQILAELERLSRAPFQRDLAGLLACPTDPGALQAFANKFPDRRAQAVAIFGRLAGYTEKLEVTGNLALTVERLSDVEVLALHAETQRKLRALDEKLGISLEPHGEQKAIAGGTAEVDDAGDQGKRLPG